MKKGDIVLVKATVTANITGHKKVLSKDIYDVPIKGMILGYSFIRTGYIEYDEVYNPILQTPITDNKVWIIESLKKGKRYLKPLKCLEEDVELIFNYDEQINSLIKNVVKSMRGIINE